MNQIHEWLIQAVRKMSGYFYLGRSIIDVNGNYSILYYRAQESHIIFTTDQHKMEIYIIFSWK